LVPKFLTFLWKFLSNFPFVYYFLGVFLGGFSNSMGEAAWKEICCFNSPTTQQQLRQQQQQHQQHSNTTKLYVEQSYEPAARSSFTSRDQWRNR
jgi:hypothetical protein